MNQITLTGNVGKDVEVKQLSNGTTVVNISLATSKRWKDNEGVWKEVTSWFICAVYGPRASAPYIQGIRKGEKLLVQGELHITNKKKKVTTASKQTVEVEVPYIEVRVDTLERPTYKAQADVASSRSSDEAWAKVGITDQEVPF
jgi:single stranded DNA-binding protein